MKSCTKKAVSMIVTLIMLISTFASMTIIDAGAAGSLVVPAGTTVYDFTKLTSKTLAAGTEGFDGFEGTVSSIASAEKSYVQIAKGKGNTLSFTTEATWSATFSSTHGNGAKGTLITAPDGTIYGTKQKTDFTLSNMPAGKYTITAADVDTDANNGQGGTETVTANHCYLSKITFTVESSTPPSDVANVTAEAGDGQVVLSWDASVLASSYKVYIDGSAEAVVTTDPGYVASGLTNDVEHTFIIKAVNSIGESAGVTVKATPKEPTDPPAVPKLSATAGNETVTLTWASDALASSYDVKRDGSVIASDVTAATYTDTGLTNGQDYKYVVTAKNKNGTADSNEVTIAPAAPLPSEINIVTARGWLESAYVTWTNPAEVEKYNVYVKGADDADYVKIDDELVRYYGTYYRADALGLKAGTYTIKVAAVKDSTESDFVITEPVDVKAHIREGFCFDPSSPNYNPAGVGGYKNDGTVKDGAQILYIDNTNKDTVKHTVVVGGKSEEGVGLVNILALREKNNAETTPLIIRMIGQVESPEGKNSAGYIQIKATENITFEGVGNDATTYHWSFLLRQTKNVEIRNLAVMEFYDDGISLDTDNYNDWVHNCDIFYGQNRGGDQTKGDGSLDVKAGSDYCTFSYNHFWDSGKCSLCGMKDDSYMGYHVTYYGNWFDHSDSRMPRVRGDQVHVYNNYFDGNSKYGVGACTGSSVFVEKNVFRNVKYPMMISMQGSDVAGENTGTFSGEDGGMIKAFDNQFIEGTQSHPVIAYDAVSAPTEFDAYVVSDRNETVPAEVVSKQAGNKYSNFDTAASMYKYEPLPLHEVVYAVEAYAGRVENGDFTHDFDDAADDTDSSRNAVLGGELQNYKTSLVSSYTSAMTYPATNGTVPSVKPTLPPAPTLDPDATPTPSPTPKPTAKPAVLAAPTTWNFGEAPFTVTDGAATHPDTTYFPLSATADRYNINNNSITPEVFSGLSFKGTSDAGYQKSGKTFADGFKGAWQLKTGGAGSATDKVFSFYPAADGSVKVYARSGSSSKDAVLTIVQGDTTQTLTLVATANETASLPVLGMNVNAKEQVKIYSSSNTGYYGIVYSSDSYVPPAADDECVAVTATYDSTGVLTDVIINTVKLSSVKANPVTNGNTKTMYWESLESMKPVAVTLSARE